MYESVEDSIGCSGIGVKTVIPVRDGYLRCDDGGFYTIRNVNAENELSERVKPQK